MKGHKQLTSSKSDEYGTPRWLFDQLNDVYSFTLDPCATNLNTKVPSKYFTERDDGLSKSWKGERVFVNPPYSKIYDWMEKCFHEWFENNILIVALIPNRSCTKYYHMFIHGVARVEPIEGRIQFIGGEGPATFPSILVTWQPRIVRPGRK